MNLPTHGGNGKIENDIRELARQGVGEDVLNAHMAVMEAQKEAFLDEFAAKLAVKLRAEFRKEGLIERQVATEMDNNQQPDLPKLPSRHVDRFEELVKMCESLKPMNTAVVYPTNEESLRGAIDAAEHNLIYPLFIGPEAEIRAAAEQANIDLRDYPIELAEDEEQAAMLAVKLVRDGKADSLMKGSLETHILLSEILKSGTGLRIEGRTISHCFDIANPNYDRPIIYTDAAVNVDPDFKTKMSICQNAIDLAQALGIETPKVAILDAVEIITPKIPSTLEAGALCKAADRGQIKGGILDGPLAFDNAISEEAARAKGINSPVAGKPDVLVFPNLVSANMMAKQQTFMSGAEAAGIIVGARAPIMLTSRADSAKTRLASAALAVLMAAAQRRKRAK